MRILTALFFIETDYIATLSDPDLLDFERSWILGIAALWHTLKPSGTAAEYRGADFLLPTHPHPEDIAQRRIALLKGFQRRLTHHPSISYHRDLSEPETLFHPPNYRQERFDIGGVARPQLAADRSALDVQGHADYHLRKIGPVILTVAASTDGLSASAFKIERGGVEKDEVHFAKQIASTVEQLFLNQILQAAWRAQSLLALGLDLGPQECHGAVEMMQ